jgi:hypothetical protein
MMATDVWRPLCAGITAPTIWQVGSCTGPIARQSHRSRSKSQLLSAWATRPLRAQLPT